MAFISKGISADDRNNIEDILKSSGFFYDFEIEIALGLVDDTITYGTETCGYHCGYTLQASLKDFYAPGDPKQIYSKIL